MAIRTVSFLRLLVVVCLLCEVFSQRSSGRNSRRLATRKGLRNGDECKDHEGTHDICVKLIKELGLRVCYTKINQLKTKLERSCAKTCHFCGEPLKNCRKSKYDCCWDARTPRGDIYGIVGCPECKDHLHLCSRFKEYCWSSQKENKEFIELHCPETCGKCTKKRRTTIKGEKIKMGDWFLL